MFWGLPSQLGRSVHTYHVTRLSPARFPLCVLCSSESAGSSRELPEGQHAGRAASLQTNGVCDQFQGRVRGAGCTPAPRGRRLHVSSQHHFLGIRSDPPSHCGRPAPTLPTASALVPIIGSVPVASLLSVGRVCHLHRALLLLLRQPHSWPPSCLSSP